MPFLIADALTTPCLTNNTNPVARKKLKEQYRKAKAYGIKAIWGVVTGSGVLELATNLAKGEIIKYAKNAHSVTSCIYKWAHDASEVPLFVFDFLLFGEYVPSCPDNEYQFFNVSSDVLENLDN